MAGRRTVEEKTVPSLRELAQTQRRAERAAQESSLDENANGVLADPLPPWMYLINPRQRQFMGLYLRIWSVGRVFRLMRLAPSTYRRWLETDERFRVAKRQADELVLGDLERETYRRAMRKSDQLLAMLLRVHDPEKYGTLFKKSSPFDVEDGPLTLAGAPVELVERRLLINDPEHLSRVAELLERYGILPSRFASADIQPVRSTQADA